MQAVVHGIYLFQCILHLNWVADLLRSISWVIRVVSLCFIVISVTCLVLLPDNRIRPGIVRNMRLVHNLVGSVGYVSPLIYSLLFSSLTAPIYMHGKYRYMRDWIHPIYVALFVTLILEYATSYSWLEQSVVPFTCMVADSLVADSTHPAKFRLTANKGTNTKLAIFTLRQPLSIITTERILCETVPETIKSITPPDEWRYIDLHGTVQGPFPRERMCAWYQDGYLKDDLRVSPADSYTFRTIREIYADKRPFT